MNNIADTLHKKAMEFTDEGILAQRRGNEELATSFFEKAYFLEKQAALGYTVNDDNSLLIKSILLRSAATLALDCGYLWEANHLTKMGLEGDIHPAIQGDFEELLVNIEEQKKKISRNNIQVTGTVISANAIVNEINIFVFTTNEHFKIFIPDGKIHDIVHNFWAKQVTVKGKTDQKGVIFMDEIQKAA